MRREIFTLKDWTHALLKKEKADRETKLDKVLEQMRELTRVTKTSLQKSIKETTS